MIKKLADLMNKQLENYFMQYYENGYGRLYLTSEGNKP